MVYETSPPGLGALSDEILAELGYTAEEVAALHSKKIVE